MIKVRPGSMRFTEYAQLHPPVMLEFDIIEIHCGPEAPFPLPPTPDEILNGALGINLGEW